MRARQQLVEHWKRELAEAELRLTAGASRFDWLQRVYVRVYRFLLAAYGDSDWRADVSEPAPEADDESRVRHMPFVDHTDAAAGLAPKSPQQIRDTLAAIHNANDGRPGPGTVTQLLPHDWITIASSKRRKAIDGVMERLSARGFEVRRVSRVTDLAVEVRRLDFDDALRALQFAEECPTLRASQYAEERPAPNVNRAPLRLTEKQSRFLRLGGLTVFSCTAIAFLVLLGCRAIAVSPTWLLITLFVLAQAGIVCLFAASSPR